MIFELCRGIIARLDNLYLKLILNDVGQTAILDERKVRDTSFWAKVKYK